jgi:hypothetical protein
VDAVAENPDAEAQNLGQRTILTSIFSGSSCNMIQHCQDALAINHHFKGANLCMTVTADPNWPEIQAELLPGQTAADRPDLVSHVFRAKVAAIIDDIKNGVLGVSVAHVFIIEFQKRSLPHMHLIIFYYHDSKLKTLEDINSLLSVELPDPNTESELYHLVVKYMVHGPCGILNPNAPKTSQSHSENTPLSLKTLIVALRGPTMAGLQWWEPKKLTIGGLSLIHLGSSGDIAVTSTWSAYVQSRLSSTYTSMCTKAMIALPWSLASPRMM